MIICLPIMMKRTFCAQGEINFSTESKGLDAVEIKYAILIHKNHSLFKYYFARLEVIRFY